MPLSASYKNYGFKMTFLPISGDVSLNLASENSNDIIIFNGESYSSGYFIISSRGFIELTLTLQGWLVTSSFGVSYKVQEII